MHLVRFHRSIRISRLPENPAPGQPLRSQSARNPITRLIGICILMAVPEPDLFGVLSQEIFRPWAVCGGRPRPEASPSIPEEACWISEFAVQWLNVSYSVWFNRRHQRSGHLLQGQFKSMALSRDEWVLGLSRYVHLNPVRIQVLGLSRTDRQGQRVGLSPAPNAEEARRRVAILRQDRWSSYRT
jgi:hypothetical protein